MRFVKKHPFATARDVIKELELKVSKNTVRRRLDIAGLFCYVRRPKCKRLNPSYTTAAFKHGGVNGVMVWGCFSGISGLEPLLQLNGIMDRFVYRDILEKQMVPFADDNMPLRWQFQQDNDPKHTSKLIKTWFNTNQISLSKLPANSPGLNPIENLWKQLDDAIRLKGTISNADQLYIELKQAWQEVNKLQICKLIESMPCRCREVIKTKDMLLIMDIKIFLK